MNNQDHDGRKGEAWVTAKIALEGPRWAGLGSYLLGMCHGCPVDKVRMHFIHDKGLIRETCYVTIHAALPEYANRLLEQIQEDFAQYNRGVS